MASIVVKQTTWRRSAELKSIPVQRGALLTTGYAYKDIRWHAQIIPFSNIRMDALSGVVFRMLSGLQWRTVCV